MTDPIDVVVLGGGAAGLVAAIRAAELGKSVVLAEKNRRPGVKILMSGGTRCNLTNARGLRNLNVVSGTIDPAYDPRQAQGARSIQQAFGENGKFLGPALRAFGVEASIELFESEGVATKVEGNGKVFPVSDRASDVLDALLRRLGRSGAQLWPDSPAQAVERTEGGFTVSLDGRSVDARRVIVATGGLSYPGSGTTGDGLTIARRFGHTIVATRPSLVPLKVESTWVPDLKGLTIPDLRASIKSKSGASLDDRREAMLFAHFGLTGPAILDVSRAVARWEGAEPLNLALDFLPDERPEDVESAIQIAARSGGRQVAGLVPQAIPKRLAESIVQEAKIPSHRIGPDLTKDERKRLVSCLKSLLLPIAGTLGYAKAEVTSGGVSLDEIDPKTLESRRQPGLYFIGEVLDLDGRIGGYNFQAAWSLGWLAGQMAAASLGDDERPEAS